MLSKYCKEKGYTKEEYLELKNEIKNKAKEIAKSTNETPGGMFYDAEELITGRFAGELRGFLIKELKDWGFEFRKENDGKLYYRR